MHHHDDDFYHDRTWFDELAAGCVNYAQRWRPRDPARLWSAGFAMFAAVCVAWAAALATHCVLVELPRNAALAQWVAVGLLLVAARHFLAVTGMSATAVLVERPRLIGQRPRVASPEQTFRVDNTATAADAGPRASGADPQLFFRAVKAAGINVRTAYALYAAGFRSAEQVRVAEDAALLAAPGVGPVTLRKLRAQFGSVASHSNAA